MNGRRPFLLFTLLALFTALVDMILVRREAARERRRLLDQIMRDRKAKQDQMNAEQ